MRVIDVPGAKPVAGAQAAGTAVTFRLPDPGPMHNYTAWRDAFDPHLTQLIAGVCR